MNDPKDEQSLANEIARLDQAWKKIEDAVIAVGTQMRNITAREDALHRFEGYKTALGAIAEAYIHQVHYDRKRPECLHTLGPIFNYAGPAPDFMYKLVHLEPGASYRVWGRRGDAEIIDFQQLAGWYGERDGTDARSSITKSNRTLDSLDIAFDAQGNFDFIFSPNKRDGQWVKLEDGTNTLLIREYFTDYETQGRVTSFYFDKLDDDDQSSTVLGVYESVARLEAVANSVRDYDWTFAMTRFHVEDGDNVYRELGLGSDDSGGASDHRYLQARFNIRSDQALVGAWMVPEDCLYWSFALYNDFYSELNFGNRQVALNHTQAMVGRDGRFYFVMAHRDPGIANWLDLDGHEKGIILTRTKGKDGRKAAGVLPTLTLVPIKDVFSHLPADIARVSKEERASALGVRRTHYHLRENR